MPQKKFWRMCYNWFNVLRIVCNILCPSEKVENVEVETEEWYITYAFRTCWS